MEKFSAVDHHCFLRKKFGTGYHLHLVKEEKFNLDAVRDILAKYVPAATLVNEYEGEVTFNLVSNTHSKFGEMFEEIEKNKSLLGINSCGVTVTTMEDVFLNVSNLADLKKESGEQFSVENADETEMKDIYVQLNRLPKYKSFENQFLGLLMKRFHYSKRHWNVVITMLILPFLIMCGCFAIINSSRYNNSSKQPRLHIDVKEVYGKTDGFYHSDSEPSSKLMADEIHNAFKEKSIRAEDVDDPREFILNYGRKSTTDYYKRLIVGGNAETANATLNLTAWFNGYPYHAEPMSLNLMNTAVLRSVVKSRSSISLTNSPLPRANTYYGEDPSHSTEKTLAIIFVPLALSFLSASFVLVPIHERTSKSKLLQIMTGVSSITYWLSMFVWDLLMSIAVTILLILPFAFFAHYAFFASHSEAIGTAIFMMILYAWASIPFSYLFTLIFKKPNTGFSVVDAINVITGVAVGSTFIMMTSGPYIKTKPVVKVFYWLLKIFPSYALASGFGNLFSIAYGNAFCESMSQTELEYNCQKADTSSPIFKCCKDICGSMCLNQTSPITFKDTACGRDILFLFLDGILYSFILLLIEESDLSLLCYRAFQHLNRSFRKVAHVFVQDSFPEDSDVLQEEERVRNNFQQVIHNDALVSLNLTKVFKNIKAVDRLTFGIHRKECFGLLGVNGAGKTTTFRMLVGDCFPTEGDAYIGDCSVTNQSKQFQSHLGYCPQFDALIDRLSARETITLFARLRGMRGSAMTRYVDALIKMTDLTQYADKPSMVYSGGNKRKLSIALALIGAPPVLLLDEPTAGVDPVSRRKIWKILSLARNHTEAAVILTTHSMEESEALCSRLAIMVNGRFRCLGSIQQLKSKFGKGYTLIIKLKNEEQAIPQSMNAVKAYIETNLPGAHLKDDHQGMLQYHVVDESVTLGYLFKFMDEMKPKYNLEDYVVSDTSLEQIFLAFARSQRVVVL